MATKSELIDAVHAKTGLKKSDIANVVDALSAHWTDAVRSGDRALIPGIGTIERISKKARMARNPATGAAVSIPERFAPKLRAAKALKDAIA